MIFWKKNDSAEGNSKLNRENVNCICTLNSYPSQSCDIKYEEDVIIMHYEDGNLEIPYDRIKSCGTILNTEYGIKEAMKNKILTQGVLQSPGFMAGNFYTLKNSASVFIYIKFTEESGAIQTFLAEYNHGVDRALRYIKKKMNKW